MQNKVLISVGGTGGHIFPAQALAKQLLKAEPGIQILFVGAGLAKNRFFDRDSFLFVDTSSANIKFKNPIVFLKNCRDIAKGVIESRRAIKAFDPQVVVGFGSYHTFPTLLAAKFSRVPIVLHEANSYPGKVNRCFSPFAKVVGIHFPITSKWLKGKTVEVGLPLRDGYTRVFASKEEARKYFFLDPQRFTFLVFGGSQGAQGINGLFSRAIVEFLGERTKQFQVLHFTGDKQLAQSLQDLYEEKGIRASVKEFESNMEMAWQAADLMISRAGAGTIAEQLEMEVPGLLIPYPYAADRHQDYNADFMVEIGGAVKKNESELDPEKLARLISDLVYNGHARLKDMCDAIRRYKKKMKRRDLCSLVCEVGGIKVR